MLTSEMIDEICADLAPFSDLGTELPIPQVAGQSATIRLFRRGFETELVVSLSEGTIMERFDGSAIRHSSLKALLASDRYGDLRTWADRQNALFQAQTDRMGLIKVTGSFNAELGHYDLDRIDHYLASPLGGTSMRALLIDGPAGIGKTYFIGALARERAANYFSRRQSLILHVESRGRALSYLSDLMAFSLQRMRLEVTFDQVPVLAKYGLVTIAIDGFDELADPDGYGNAWHQVNDLVGAIRGQGVMILAGRETFIGRQRMLRDVQSLREAKDDVSVLTLRPPTKGEALGWLGDQGWNEEQLRSVEEFLEPSSLALRPFFLKTLSDASIMESIPESGSTNILSILIDAMIDREASKFGDEVEQDLSLNQRRRYVFALVSEVARDMADNGAISVSDATLSFLAEVALPDDVSDRTKRILKQRAQVIAFLTNDERLGYRRFYHDKFYDYFLSKVVFDSIIDKKTIKPVSRGLFGSGFLETFGTVLLGTVSENDAKKFLIGALSVLSSTVSHDRSRRNVGAFLISSLSVSHLVDNFVISDVDVDEVRFSGTSGSATLKRLVISQFDCRGADLTEVNFEDCTIVTVIGDSSTLIPSSFPVPALVQDVEANNSLLAQKNDIESWLVRHTKDAPDSRTGLVPEEFRDHPVVRLLKKACRIKQYWLRRSDDVYATRILEDKNWPVVERVLDSSGLVTIENRQASGSDGRFIHIKKSQHILEEDDGDEEIVLLYRNLVDAIC